MTAEQPKDGKYRRLVRLAGVSLGAALLTLFAVAFFLPEIASRYAQSYFMRYGATFTGCKVERDSAAVYTVPGCVLDLRSGEDPLKVAVERLKISFDTFRSLLSSGPKIEIGSVDVSAPSFSALTAFGRTGDAAHEGGSASLPFFSEMSVEQGKIALGTDSNLRFASSIRKTASGNAEFSLESLALTSPPYFNSLPFLIQGIVELGGSANSAKFTLKAISLTEAQAIATTFGLRLNVGTISGKGNAHWAGGRPPAAQIDITGDNLGGILHSLSFAGGKTQVALDNSPDWRTANPAHFSVEQVNLGVPLTETQFQFAFKRSPSKVLQFEITDASTKLFGGLLHTDRAAFEPGKPTAMTISGDDLDLSQLLAFAGNTVQGAGKITAAIPLEVGADGVRVRNGKVTSKNGELSYVPSEESKQNASGNPGLAIALQALEKFRYESLDADVEYLPDGTLTSKIALVGSNPQLFQGRQINFNINVEENLLALLKSARLATQAGPDVWKTDE